MIEYIYYESPCPHLLIHGYCGPACVGSILVEFTLHLN